MNEELNILACDWHGYKQMAADFLINAPTLNVDELDNAFKCLTLGYLNLECDPMWKPSALTVLQMATQAFMLREVTLGLAK